jgi:hypothetical protein
LHWQRTGLAEAQQCPGEPRRIALQRGGAGGGLVLPEAVRRAAYEHLVRLEAEHGLQVHVCGCKNPDVASGRCHLVRSAEGDMPESRPQEAARLLWALPPSS